MDKKSKHNHIEIVENEDDIISEDPPEAFNSDELDKLLPITDLLLFPEDN